MLMVLKRYHVGYHKDRQWVHFSSIFTVIRKDVTWYKPFPVWDLSHNHDYYNEDKPLHNHSIFTQNESGKTDTVGVDDMKI